MTPIEGERLNLKVDRLVDEFVPGVSGKWDVDNRLLSCSDRHSAHVYPAIGVGIFLAHIYFAV